MKKALIILVIILCSAQLYSAEPLVKFYLQDGSSKQFNLSDIDSLNVIDKKNNYVMRIHYKKKLVVYYPNEIIGSIKLEKDSATRDILSVYISSFPKSYLLNAIDSLVFYIDQFQPLTIGSQVWMLKNLNVDHYRNGDSIPELRDSVSWSNLKTGAWCYYSNDSANSKTYGRLYNWYAVNDLRALAPIGWHISDEGDWDKLNGFVGNEAISGIKLKESGISHWLKPNTGATNESGFSALPGGYRNYNGTFINIGKNAFWWSFDQNTSTNAWNRILYYDKINFGISTGYKIYGYSVRCVKD
jgi:uncharacterized protein (TIGR02145 family)